jgi:hypothetical protein
VFGEVFETPGRDAHLRVGQRRRGVLPGSDSGTPAVAEMHSIVAMRSPITARAAQLPS